MTPLSKAIAEQKKIFSESTIQQVKKINHEIVKIANRLIKSPIPPRTIAQATWEADSTICFHRAEMLCLLKGFILSTPTLFVMGIFLDGDSPDDLLTDISRQARRMTTNPTLCHVWLASGNLRELVSLLEPYPQITHVSFQKHGYHIHRIPINKLAHYGKRTTSTKTSTAPGDEHQQR